jgi:TetR/AcrR family transcriptional regulator, transcriptional repressor for nem operon
MNAKDEQKARSHLAILDAAAAFVRKSGIAGARIADVMQDAGLTVGGFYAHFRSKEELIAETLRRTAAQNRERLLQRIDEKPADKRAVVIVKRYLSTAHRDEVALGCPLPAVVGEIATTAPEHAPVLAELIDENVDAVSAHLPRTQAFSKRTLALALMALMYGGLSLSRALKGTPLSDEILKACRAVGISIVESEEK